MPDSPNCKDAQLAFALLTEIVYLHPARLTAAELVLRMAREPDGPERVALEDSLQGLKRDGLVRQTGEVLEPTYAALRATAIFSAA